MQRFISLSLAVTVISSTNAAIPRDMTKLINSHANPCHDFYEYACGGWIAATKLKPYESHLEMAYDEINTNNAQIFTKIISQNHKIVGEMWDSCMAVDKLSQLGNQPLQDDLKRIFFAQTKADILELAGEFSRTGTKTFLDIFVAPDSNDAVINALYITIAPLTLKDVVYYEKDTFETISTSFHSYINEVMMLSGFPFAHETRAADIVSNIEIELAKYKPKRTHQVHRQIIDLTNRFPIAFGAFSRGVGISKDSTIIVVYDEYIDFIESFIRRLSVNDLKVYLAFAMVHSRAQWLGGKLFDLWYTSFQQEHSQDRFDFCLTRLIEYTPDLFGKHYTKMAFDKQREHYVLEIVNQLKEAMKVHIARSTWLKSNDQDAAYEKLSKITTLIGQTTVFKSYPRSLSRTDYPTNIYSILSHHFDTKLRKVGQRVNRMEWHQSAAQTNAYYTAQTNSILFPSAILQPPLFKAQFHPARNFGGIGAIIGHELTHAFDNTGRFYDGDGNRRQWWDEDTIKILKDRTQCMEDQYSAFEVDGDSGFLGLVDGKQTLDENIADSGGLALAWDAYRNYMSTFKPLTGRVSTGEGDEMFFLAFAQSWCTKYTDGMLNEHRVLDSHTPAKWRVNGAVMNNEKFAMVFHCDTDTPMNPSKKCSIW